MRIYLELASRSFAQQFIYRAATIAGLFTNGIFGIFLASIYLALYQSREDGAVVNGFDVQQAITFVWIGQALIMPVNLWGWWRISETIQSGQIVMDLLKPMNYFVYWLSQDLGRAAAQCLLRMAPTLVIGALFFELRWPAGPWRWAAFLLSVVGAVITSFGVRFILNLLAMWTIDHRGLNSISLVITGLLSGHLVPISWFPTVIRPGVNVLPFRAMIMTPIEIWLGQVSIWQGLGLQLWWSVVMIGLSLAFMRQVERRVVVHGG